jgi:hypothetical protein
VNNELRAAAERGLSALVAAGGNSRAARSARAKLQWRDRFGRFIEMGRGIKFKVRFPDGTTKSVTGKFFGAIDGDTGQVYVNKDPNGLPNGFYEVKSSNAQEILVDLSPEALAKAGIELGKRADGTTIGDRADADIPTVDQLVRTDAPEGWKVADVGLGGIDVWETVDGEYRLYHGYRPIRGKITETWAVEDVKGSPGRLLDNPDLGKTLGQLGTLDDMRGAREAADAGSVAAQQPQEEDPNASIEERLAPYDPDGAIAEMIKNGASGKDVLAKLRENDLWNDVENDLVHPADVRSAAQKARDSKMEALRQEINNLNKPNPDAPASGGSGDSSALDLRNVAPEGFIIPVGKESNDTSPEGIASFIEANKDFLTETDGHRLVIDTDKGTVAIYNSADSLINAKAQAGGAGAPEFIDLATGEIIPNDKNVGAPDGNTNPEGKDTPNEDSSSDSQQSESTDAGTDSDVDAKPSGADNGDTSTDSGSGDSGDTSTDSGADKPKDSEPADKPASDNRDYLEELGKRLDLLNKKFSETTNSAALNRIESQIAEIEQKLAELDSPDASPDAPAVGKKPTPTPTPTPTPDSAAEKPEDKAETPAPEEEPAVPTQPWEVSGIPAARAYEEMVNDPENPEVKASYDALIRRVIEQYQEMKALGLNIELSQGDPYENSADMVKDVDENRTLKAFADGGATLPEGHPMKQMVNIDGEELNINDVFRAVHDYFGHVKSRDRGAVIGFGPKGEWEAWRTHRLTLPEESWMALWDETRGQNTWTNYANDHMSLPIQDRPYAEQKAGVVSPEFYAADLTGLEPTNLPDVRSLSDSQLEDQEIELGVEVDSNPNASPSDISRLADLRSEIDRRTNIAETPQESTPAPESVPEPVASPEPSPVTPDLVQADTELPDDIAELTRRAAILERRAVATRSGAAQRVIEAELAAVYDKMDEIEARDAAPSEPEAPRAAVDEPRVHAIENTVVGKDIAPERLEEIQNALTEDDLSADELSAIESEVRNAPDKANLVSTPRIPKVVDDTTPSSELISLEDSDPSAIVDPDLIIRDVIRNHPGYKRMKNGDLILEEQNRGNKRYALVVRQTTSNRFFTYILETDTKTGKRRAVRLQNETHSYKALSSKIAKGKRIIGTKSNLGGWMNRTRRAEYLPANQNMGDSKLSRYIDGTDVTRTENDNFNALVEILADRIVTGEDSDKVLKKLASSKGFSTKLVAQVRESVQRRQIMDAGESLSPAYDQPAHLSYDGDELSAGQWIDWTDTDKTIPQKDAEGNTIYQQNSDGSFVLRPNGTKIPLNMPNPNYGRVYRGYVKQLRYEAINSQGYAYGDNTLSVFPERNIELGRKPSWQGLFVSSGLRAVDGPDANANEPFYPKEREAREQQKIADAAAFGVPKTGDKRQPRAAKPAPKTVEPTRDADSGTMNIDGFDTDLPATQVEATERAQTSTPESMEASEMLPGDQIVRLDNGGHTSYETVVAVEAADSGQTRVTAARPEADGTFTISERDFGPQRSLVLRPSAQSNVTDMERQRDMIRTLIGERNLSASELAEFRDLLIDQDASTGDLADAIRKLETKRDAPKNADPETSVIDLLEDVTTPDEHERIVLSNAQNREFITSDDDGLPVRAIPLDEIDSGKKRSPFDNIPSVYMEDLQIGDLIPKGSGQGRYFLQVVGDPQPDARRDVRLIGRDNDIYSPNGDIYRKNGEVFPLNIDRERRVINVKRPNGYTPRDYFRDEDSASAEAIELLRGSRRFDDQSLTPENPRLLEDIQERGQALVDMFNAGYTSLRENVGGAMNSRAEIVDLGGGVKAFLKKGLEHDDPGNIPDVNDVESTQQNEILANRIAHALDIDEVDMGTLDDGLTVISNMIDGDLALDIPDYYYEGHDYFHTRGPVFERFWEFPNSSRIGILDYLINNADRHPGNLFINSAGQPVPIDHSNSGWEYFDDSSSPFAEVLLREIRSGSAPLTTAELLRYKANIQLLYPEFVKMGRKHSYESVMRRLQTLIRLVGHYAPDTK